MKVLAAIDFSDVTLKIIDYVRSHYCGTGHEIILMHAADPDPAFVGYEPGPQEEREFIAKHFHEEHQRIQQEAKDLRADSCNISPLLLQGAAAEKILAISNKSKAELIILGSHGHGAVFKLLVGSTTEAVLKDASCPVLIIPCRNTSRENT